ncbi:MAG TPA: sugar transferase [Thermoleophilaceae bacterium]|nr:sugar transferase [Thermoleophilaceae bacterium]
MRHRGATTLTRPTYRMGKRAFDIASAALGIVILSPLLAAIAMAVWIDDPRAAIIFRQRRCGYGGRPFTLLKFRTMVRGADALKETLRERSLVGWPDFRLVDDPRVTRLGRLLRRTSLDELPQLVNVLLGHMSLVGPRPTSFDFTTYELWQTARLDFRPGVTGPWQIYGRNRMDFTERCRLEIQFFRTTSMPRELRLIVATAVTVLKRTGVA